MGILPFVVCHIQSSHAFKTVFEKLTSTNNLQQLISDSVFCQESLELGFEWRLRKLAGSEFQTECWNGKRSHQKISSQI